MSPADAHPPAQLLAEVAEGSLDEGPAAEVSAHVEHCAECQAVMRRLDQVTTQLRNLPAELPIPRQVAGRLSATLIAAHEMRDTVSPVPAAAAAASVVELAEPAAEPATTATDDAGPTDHGTVAWFRRRVPQVLAAAASAAVIGLAGYAAVSVNNNGGDEEAGVTAADAEAGSGSDDSAESVPDTVGPNSAPRGDFSYNSKPESPSENDSQTPAGSDVEPEQLTAAVVELYQQPEEYAPDCGKRLADEVDQRLVGSAPLGAGVLVVVENAGNTVLRGWLIGTCNSLTREALEEPVDVPVPQR